MTEFRRKDVQGVIINRQQSLGEIESQPANVIINNNLSKAKRILLNNLRDEIVGIIYNAH